MNNSRWGKSIYLLILVVFSCLLIFNKDSQASVEYYTTMYKVDLYYNGERVTDTSYFYHPQGSEYITRCTEGTCYINSSAVNGILNSTTKDNPIVAVDIYKYKKDFEDLRETYLKFSEVAKDAELISSYLYSEYFSENNDYKEVDATLDLSTGEYVIKTDFWKSNKLRDFKQLLGYYGFGVGAVLVLFSIIFLILYICARVYSNIVGKQFTVSNTKVISIIIIFFILGSLIAYVSLLWNSPLH